MANRVRFGNCKSKGYIRYSICRSKQKGQHAEVEFVSIVYQWTIAGYPVQHSGQHRTHQLELAMLQAEALADLTVARTSSWQCFLMSSEDPLAPDPERRTSPATWSRKRESAPAQARTIIERKWDNCSIWSMIS